MLTHRRPFYDDQGNRISAAEASIKVNAGNIEQKVSKNGVVSAINMTEEEVKIEAEKINLNGAVTANENFKVLEDGSVETKDIKISGAFYQPFVFVENSDADAYRIAAGDYDSYADVDSDDIVDASGKIKTIRPYYTEEQLRRAALDPSDADYFELPSYARWFGTTATPVYSVDDFKTAISSGYMQYGPNEYGIHLAYKIKNQFQLDVTWQTVVLPSDSKYVGCRIVLYNSNYLTTRTSTIWSSPVVAESGCLILKEGQLLNALAFRGGTVELMMIAEHENSNSQNPSSRFWVILSSNCITIES